MKRYLLGIAALTPALFGQGMASGGGVARPAKPLPAGMKAPTADFRDVAAEAGLRGINVSGATRGQQFIVETTGNGVVAFDYDGDGLQDLFFPNGSRLDAGGTAPRHYLYRNLGGLKFEDTTRQAGIEHTGWGQGACAGDIDNDARIDLFITQWGEDVMYRNRGDGTFEDQTKARGLHRGATRWSTGCAFLDYDNDGDLDLFVAHYLRLDPASTPKPGQKAQCQWKNMPVVCGPRGLPAESMSLFANDGGGSFSDVTKKAGIETPKDYYGFTALTGDFDNDGWVDIYVACDSTASLFFRNKGDGTFEETGLLSGAGLNEDGREQAGMGATAADYNGDGRLDIFKTNFSDDTPTLYQNDGEFSFTDVTVRAGLAIHTKFLGWGAAFLDFDHDGRPDLFHVNGHVYPEVDEAKVNEHWKQPRLLYWNRGDGQFHDVSAAAGPGVLDGHSSRGIAVADFDNDGVLEIAISNMHEAPSLLRNFAPPEAGAILVEALTAKGRHAIGARITVTAGGRKQIQDVRSGGYHVSQGDLRLHFGIGGAAAAEVQIRWPGGKVETFAGVARSSWITVREGQGIVKRTALTMARPAAALRP